MKQSRSLFNTAGCLLALASLLINSSCSQDEFAMTPVQDGQARFSISLPGEIGTRATFGDGDKAYVNTLYWTLYESKDGETSSYEKVVSGDIKGAFEDGTQKVSLPLVVGKTYRIAFCAMNSNNKLVSYDDGKIFMHYSDAACNSVNDDVFTAVSDLIDMTKGKGYDGSIILTRPLAQVNWGSTDFEEEAVDAHIDDTSATVTYNSGLYSSLDLLNNTVDGLIEQPVSFPAIDCGNLPSQDFPVAGNVARLVAMNYLLTGPGSSAINCEIAFENGFNTNVEVNNVPLQANYRTNIYGGLITNSGEVSVEMKKAFETATNDQRYLTPETIRVMNELKEGKSEIIIPAEETIDLTGLDTFYLIDGQKIKLDGTLILDSQQFKVNSDDDVPTIPVVTFEGKGIIYSMSSSPIYVDSEAKCVFNGIKIICETEGSGNALKSRGNIELNSVTIKSTANGIYVEQGGYLKANNCKFVANVYDGGKIGAAVMIESESSMDISDCNLSSASGLALYINSGYATLKNCILDAHGKWDTIKIENEAQVYIINCTVESENKSVLSAENLSTNVHVTGGYYHSLSKDRHTMVFSDEARASFTDCSVVSENGAAVQVTDYSDLTIYSGRYLSLGQYAPILLDGENPTLQITGGEIITDADSSIKLDASEENLILRGGIYSAKCDYNGVISDLPADNGYEVVEIDSATPEGFKLRYKIAKIEKNK